MQIVIDIPNAMYEDIKSGKDGYSNYVHTAIRNGTPLPKGHGDLIDKNQIQAIELEDSTTFMRYTKGSEVDLWIDTPTIIEADKGE